MFRSLLWWSLVVGLLLVSRPALADNEGLADLDEAIRLKVTAEGMDDLYAVVERLDSALEKGLDEENGQFAQQMLISTLLQRAMTLSGAIFDSPVQDARRVLQVMRLRQLALNDLQRVIDIDGQMWDAYLVMGRLHAVPPEDAGAARRSFSRVIDAADAPPAQQAEALALRSALQRDPQQQLEDLNRAVALMSDEPDYYRQRARFHLGKENYRDALSDIDQALKLDDQHVASHELRGMILLGLERYEDALASFDRAGELAPQSDLPYQRRAELFRQQGDLNKAVEQLSKALELSPENVATLLLRAGVYYQLEQLDKAEADVEEAIRIEPKVIQSHLMLAEIYAVTDRLDEAIAQLERLTRLAPGLNDIHLQLGTFYMLAEQPRKAIYEFSRVIELDSKNFRAYRLRGDAYLNIGQHKEAIADFERALELDGSEEGLLNNFAWVLATSPDDELRDGRRAITLATKACEEAGYETPHILSTLAAAYAETGDYQAAIKWSEKAVEFSQKAIDQAADEQELERLKENHVQMEKELASYHEGKPWRERQTAGEPEDSNKAEDQAAAPVEKAAEGRTADF